MQAYEAGLKPGDTRLLLSPNSEFLRYFNNPNGKRGAQGPETNGQVRPAPTTAPAQ
jgi:membrane protease subunit HflC